MRYSVTGATGLLGNNLVRALLNAGHQVRVAVRGSSDLKPLHGLDVQVVSGDLNDADFAASLMQDSDGLFHSAGFIWFGRKKLQQSMQVNVDASLTLAHQCARQGVRMVHVSSCDSLAAGTRERPATEADLEPAKGDSAYVISKRRAERELLSLREKVPLDVVVVCPGLLIGPFDWKPSSGRMMLAVTDGFVPLAPSGGISVADVRNVADAMMKSMIKQNDVSGQRFILAGANISYLDLWRKMAALAGRRGPLGKMTRAIERVVGFGGDRFGALFGESNVNSAAIQLGANWNYYDSSKAIQELDYQPGDLDLALVDAWKWLRDNGYSRNS